MNNTSEAYTHYYLYHSGVSLSEDEFPRWRMFDTLETALAEGRNLKSKHHELRWWVERFDFDYGAYESSYYWVDGTSISFDFKDSDIEFISKHIYALEPPTRFIHDVLFEYHLFRATVGGSRRDAVLNATRNCINAPPYMWDRMTLFQRFRAYTIIDRIIITYDRLNNKK